MIIVGQLLGVGYIIGQKMNNMTLRFIKAQCVLVIILGFLSCRAEAKRQPPLVWDMEYLEQIRNNYRTNEDAQSIIRYADKYCDAKPFAVTEDKHLSLGPNEHYLSSMGPYRWKDPKNPGKYIIKDGEFNPDWKYYDSGKLNEMVTRCMNFSKAYYITREEKYYNAFIKQIRAWFINKETFMEPNFEFSQFDPTQEVFKSNSTGMIDAYVFINLTESIYLVNKVKKIDRKTMRAMKKWMRRFAEWSDNQYTSYFDKVNNNISLAFDVTLADLYLFAGESSKAKKIIDEFAEKRLSRQIKEDGSQPAELSRTRAYYYSLYNLSHITDFCALARYWYPDYYQNHSERIEKAFAYLQKFADEPSTFPYQQITDWDSCIQTFNELKQKRNKLIKR